MSLSLENITKMIYISPGKQKKLPLCTRDIWRKGQIDIAEDLQLCASQSHCTVLPLACSPKLSQQELRASHEAEGCWPGWFSGQLKWAIGYNINSRL